MSYIKNKLSVKDKDILNDIYDELCYWGRQENHIISNIDKKDKRHENCDYGYNKFDQYTRHAH